MEEAQSDAQGADVFSLESHEESMIDNIEENHNPKVEESDRFRMIDLSQMEQESPLPGRLNLQGRIISIWG
jgi:hypothetical protein